MKNLSRIIRQRHILLRHRGVAISTSYSTESEEKIDIPNRIQRGPTDILRALESTISRDPTATHYKYHDDPFLIPMSNIGKRTFAMAQEAGRKAAHWVRREHADLFNSKEADPPIEAFFPPMIYNEDSEVSETDLKNLIKNVQVSDAILVFKLLKQRGIEVPVESIQSLLELLCFQNCEDTLSEEFIEERWFKQSSRTKEKQRKTWKDGEFAEELFIALENPTPDAYAALIQGMAKYYQVERAWQLFEETQQKGITLNTNTYNSLISIVSFLKEDFEMRWSSVINLLTLMKNSQLKPNLGTLNAILQAISTMGSSEATKQNCLKVLAEFKKLGVEPSLASWYFVLITFCKERGPVSTILNDIIAQIEDREHQIQDLKDTNFFVTAMDVCRNHLNDVELAQRVHKLLQLHNNYDLIGDSYKESIYYRHYFSLLCNNATLDEFMRDTYEVLVPHIYVPEPGIMGEVLNQVDLNGSVEYIPKLWSDMVIFDHTHRENLLDHIINIMINNEPLPDSELNEKFCNIAWDVYTRIDNQSENRINKINFTGDLLGKIMTLVLRNKDFGKACQIMEKLDKEHQSIVGVPKIDALSLFVDQCIEEKAPSRAINCIQYCSDCGFAEANLLAARLHEKLNLDETYLNRLSKIVGDLSLAKIKGSV